MRIALPRGDIRYERFLINDPNGTGTDIDFDDVYFTVKKSAKDRLYFFQKSLKAGTIEKLALGDYQLKINPEDTAKMSFGKYVFDVQVSYGNVLKESWKGDFDLLEEVTYPENE